MLAQLSCAILGLLSGAMLFIAVVVAPWWRALPPAEFQAWFTAHAGRIGALMFTLGGAAALTALGALVAGWRIGGERRLWLAAAALGAVGVVLVTITVNEPANRRFATPGALDAPACTALLARWAAWHWVRVALGIGALLSAVRSLAVHPAA